MDRIYTRIKEYFTRRQTASESETPPPSMTLDDEAVSDLSECEYMVSLGPKSSRKRIRTELHYAAACSIWALKTGSDQHELIFVHVLRMLSIAIEAWFHFENPHPAAWLHSTVVRGEEWKVRGGNTIATLAGHSPDTRRPAEGGRACDMLLLVAFGR